MRSKIPVTLLAGYLGAGKTTLINHVLQHANGLRIAVMVNDFGDLPIDASLIVAADDDIIQLSGGCVCCSYGNDLTRALARLQEMDSAPEHVLIECSGVALPRPVMSSLSLIDGLVYDGTVVVVDGVDVRRQLTDRYVGDTVTRQLEQADLVVVNKIDCLSASDHEATNSALNAVLGSKPTVGVVQGCLPVAIVLSSKLIGSQSQHIENTTQVSHQQFDSDVIRPAGPVVLEELKAVLAQKNWGVLRAKGYVRNTDGNWFLLQQVGNRCSFTQCDVQQAPGFVVIGVFGLLKPEAIALEVGKITAVPESQL